MHHSSKRIRNTSRTVRERAIGSGNLLCCGRLLSGTLLCCGHCQQKKGRVSRGETGASNTRIAALTYNTKLQARLRHPTAADSGCNTERCKYVNRKLGATRELAEGARGTMVHGPATGQSAAAEASPRFLSLGDGNELLQVALNPGESIYASESAFCYRGLGLQQEVQPTEVSALGRALGW